MTAKQQYYEGRNLVIAECERCGRGFLTVGPQMRDGYAPQRGSRFFGQGTICNGRIVMLEPIDPVATPPDRSEP